jgi:hypothetical protein
MNNEADDTHTSGRPVLTIQWQCTSYYSSADDIRYSDNSNIHHENSSLLSENGVIHLGPVYYLYTAFSNHSSPF